MTNVVSIDHHVDAREISAAARRRYMAERSEREVAAIGRNRRARLLRQRKAWLTISAATAVIGSVAGIAATLWWQQSSAVTAIATASRPQDVSLKKLSETPARVVAETIVQSSSAIATVTQPAGASQTAAVATVLVTPTVVLPVVTPSMPALVVAALPVSKPAQQSQSDALPGGKPALRTALPAVRAKQAVVLPMPTPTPSPVQAQAVQREPLPTTQYESSRQLPARPFATQAKQELAQETKQSAPVSQNAPTYKVIGVPVDGLLQIQIGSDPTVKNVRVGERLPGGEVLRSANAETNLVETSERGFKVRP